MQGGRLVKENDEVVLYLDWNDGYWEDKESIENEQPDKIVFGYNFYSDYLYLPACVQSVEVLPGAVLGGVECDGSEEDNLTLQQYIKDNMQPGQNQGTELSQYFDYLCNPSGDIEIRNYEHKIWYCGNIKYYKLSSAAQDNFNDESLEAFWECVDLDEGCPIDFSRDANGEKYAYVYGRSGGWLCLNRPRPITNGDTYSGVGEYIFEERENNLKEMYEEVKLFEQKYKEFIRYADDFFTRYDPSEE